MTLHITGKHVVGVVKSPEKKATIIIPRTSGSITMMVPAVNSMCVCGKTVSITIPLTDSTDGHNALLREAIYRDTDLALCVEWDQDKIDEE